MTSMIVRPTVMGLAFVNVAAKAIGNKPIEKAIHDPKVHWVARRVATGQGKVGIVREASSHHNLMTPQERENEKQLRKALGIKAL